MLSFIGGFAFCIIVEIIGVFTWAGIRATKEWRVKNEQH